MRTLLKLALFLIVGLLAYNYFLGTPEEKAQSREIAGKAKELGSEAWKLLRMERTKLKEGKYDDALNRLESLYVDLKNVAAEARDSETMRRLEDLSQRREELQGGLDQADDLNPTEQKELDDLTADTEELMHEMEAKSQPPAPY